MKFYFKFQNIEIPLKEIHQFKLRYYAWQLIHS